MSISYLNGNLFDAIEQEKQLCIFHSCNAQGVMGSGFAKEFRINFPQAYTDYVSLCRLYPQKENLLGLVSETKVNENVLCSGIAQLYYGRNPATTYVSYVALLSCLSWVMSKHKELDIHMPKIGTGLGNGKWNVIEKVILRSIFKTNYLKTVHVYVL
jgi:O-acetyl-ADP-ribose deacetylase (regulator of RNase III)